MPQIENNKVSIPSDSKLSTLDGLRGLAAVLVVLRHSDSLIISHKFNESYLAVDLFFLMSGYVIAKAYEAKLVTGSMTTWSFYKLRFIRLYPLYAIGGGLGITFMLLWHFWDPQHKIAISRILIASAASLFMLPTPWRTFELNPPTWSLFCEAVVNLFYGRFAKALTNAILLVTMAISLVILVFSTVKFHTLDREAFPFGFARVFFSFSLGVLLFRHKLSFKSVNNFFPLLSIFAVGGLLCLNIKHSFDGLYALFVICCGFPLIVWCSSCYEPSKVIRKTFIFLGAVSYSIYVIHQPVINILENCFKKFASVSLEDYKPWTWLIVLFIIALSALLDKVYDLPVRKYLTAKFIKRNPTSPRVDKTNAL